MPKAKPLYSHHILEMMYKSNPSKAYLTSTFPDPRDMPVLYQAMQKTGVNMLAPDPYHEAISKELFGNSYKKSPGYLNWFTKYITGATTTGGKDFVGRAKFFESFSPLSFEENYLTKAGVGYENVGGKTKLFSVIQSKKALLESDFNKAVRGGLTRGWHHAGATTVGEKSGPLSREMFNRILASDEYRGNIGFTKEPISRVGGAAFLGRPTLTGNKIFQTGEQQLDWAKRATGQKRYLEEIGTGKVLSIGRQPIVRSIPLEVLDKPYIKTMKEWQRMSKMRPEQFVDALKTRYKGIIEASGGAARVSLAESAFKRAGPEGLKAIGGIGLDDYNDLVRTRNLLKKFGGRRAAEASINYNLVNRMKGDIVKFQKDMMVRANISINDIIREQANKRDIRGFINQRKFVNDSRVGTEVLLKRGSKVKRAVIKEVSDISQINYLRSGGKGVGLFPEAISAYEANMGARQMAASRAPDLLPVRFARIPLDKLEYGPGGMTTRIKAPLATKVITEGGAELGYLKNKNVPRYSTHIKSGLLEERGFARVYPYKVPQKIGKKTIHKQLYGLAVFPSEEHAFIKSKYGHWKARRWGQVSNRYKLTGFNITKKVGPDQGILGSIMAGKQTYIKGVPEKKLLKKFPVKLKMMADVDAVTKTSRLGKLGRGALIGAAVTAGAMLLWNASRDRKKQPLTERDLPESMYGNGEPRMPQQQNIYSQPKVRLINNIARPTPTDYRMDIDTTDENMIMDYRSIANTLSNMSQNALGADEIRTNLNINDKSGSTDRHAIRRRIINQLNR